MPRILLITSVLPWPLRRNGGGQRTALVRRALSRLGDVEILAVGGSQLIDDGVSPDDLAAHGVVGCFVRNPPAPRPAPAYAVGPLRGLHKLLEDWRGRFRPDDAAARWLDGRAATPGTRYDLIVGRYLAAALQGGAGTGAVRGVPKLLDFDDMEWQTLEAQLAHEPWPGVRGRLGAMIVPRDVRRQCLRSLPLFRHAWVTSAEDAAMLPARGYDVSVLPNIPYADPDGEAVEPADLIPPVTGAGPEVMFVGDLQLPPNREGLNRFIPRAWPRVRQAMPDARLRIYGRGLTDEQRARWSAFDGVEVVGYAADLSQCYARAALSLVPTYFGGGTKIKVLEALSHGRPVVTTRHGLRGYAALNAHGPAVWVGDDDASLADGCVRLLSSPSLRAEMADRGRAAVRREFSFAKFQEIVDAAVAPVLRDRAGSEIELDRAPALPAALAGEG